MSNSSKRRRWMALAGSFAVYLIPLVGPHAVWLFGEQLFHELTAAPRREVAWIAADVALALGVQFAAGLFLVWALRGSRARLLVVVASVPLFFVAVERTYLQTIPLLFLVERDTAPERRDWPEHCAVPDASLMSVRTPTSQLPMCATGGFNAPTDVSCCCAFRRATSSTPGFHNPRFNRAAGSTF